MDGWVFVAILAAVVVGAVVLSARRPEKLCTACGTVDRPSYKSTGSIGIGLFMWIGGIALAATVHWLFLLMPIGHLIARIASSGVLVCARCGSANLVPVDSPVAQKLLRELERDKN